MPKNIVVCCDGTNNQFSGDHTNVIRTYKVLQQIAEQASFYDPGVGTMPEPWAMAAIARRWSMIKGLAFGSGFLQNVEDAYKYLMSVYEPGDIVFLFGFSRGAYTVRALAGLLHSVGLLRPGSENLVRYATRYWRKDRGPDSDGGKVCAEFKNTLAVPCPVHFIGVWDTVGSVGFLNHFRTFPYTYKNPEVTCVRHAVSIDEKRKCFRQNLMVPAFPNQDIMNVWFAGVHSDVGGGYAPNEAGLAKIAFAWMMGEAGRFGLNIDPVALKREVDGIGSRPDPAGQLHQSLKGGWWLVELIPDKRYSFADHRNHWHFFDIAKPRSILASASEIFVGLHVSVLQRMRARPDYRPTNLPTGESEIRAKIHIVGEET